ncbi:MAG: hypothetical protein WA484_09095, partial [Solirubrobacteraceae bacterium]
VRHLVVSETEPDRRLAQSAAVIVRADALASADSAREWALQVLAEYRGARIAAVIDTAKGIAQVFRRNEPELLISSSAAPEHHLDPKLFVSAAYALDISGRLSHQPLSAVTIQCGGLRQAVTLTAQGASRSPDPPAA